MFSLILGHQVQVGVTVTEETYRGWTNSYRIANGVVEVVVVPKIGRIMHYAGKGQKNILWENLSVGPEDFFKPGYDNAGGDKVWTAPQSAWNWPPDPQLDGAPFTAEVLKNGVRITSPEGKYYPVVVMRDITLKDIGTEVRITNRMQNKGRVAEVAPWQVTQIANPSVIEMPTDLNYPTSAGYRILMGEKLDAKYHEYGAKKLRIARHPKKSYKFGTKASAGAIRANVNGVIFESQSSIVRRAKYPDGDCAQEVYTNPDPDKYAELEQLGPLQKLETREIVFQNVTWRLLPVR